VEGVPSPRRHGGYVRFTLVGMRTCPHDSQKACYRPAVLPKLGVDESLWRMPHGLHGHRCFATSILEQVLEDQLRALGPHHPIALATRDRLAGGRFAVGDFAGAAQAYEDLIADQVRALGADHPETLTNKANLALILAVVSDDPIDALERLLADRSRVGEPDDPRAVDVSGILSAARHNRSRSTCNTRKCPRPGARRQRG
jgi:hypothetical protein